MWHHERHKCADERIKITIAWVASIFIVVAPVVSWWCVAVVDDDLARPRLSHLVTMHI